MNRRQDNNRGKRSAVLNLITLTAAIGGLSVYFTVKGLWQVGTIAVIVLLIGAVAFYFWLWRYFKKG